MTINETNSQEVFYSLCFLTLIECEARSIAHERLAWLWNESHSL